jgi:hypothetical protein
VTAGVTPEACVRPARPGVYVLALAHVVKALDVLI